MTAMPQLVAMFNGFGGAASVFVAAAALIESGLVEVNVPMAQLVPATVASGIIGAVTFWGSLVAYFKVQEVFIHKFTGLPGQKFLNAVLAVVCLAIGVMIVM